MYIFSPPLLCCLQLLGLTPVDVNHFPLRGDVAKYSRMRILYSILLLAFKCTLFYFWYWKPSESAQVDTQATFKITSICYLFATFFGAVVPVGVAATSAEQKILLVEKMREVDFLLQHKLGPPRSRKVSLAVMCFVSILFVLEVLQLLYNINGQDVYFNLATHGMLIYFRAVIVFSLVEVMEVVLSVRERFKLVNERVLEVVLRNQSKRLMWTVALPCVETFAMPQETKMTVLGLSEVHWSVCCIVYDINAVYGCQSVTAMIFIFAHLVYSPFLLFLLFDNFKRNAIIMAFNLIWTLLGILFLFMLVTPCSLTVNEAKRTVTVVTKLMGNRMAKPQFDELETFADQLFHRDVDFTACGFFTMQTSLVISVASAVTTYMAIIIQFQAAAEVAMPSDSTLPVTASPYPDNTTGSSA